MIISVILVSIIVILLIYSFIKFSYDRPPNFPPGPPRLPIWGSYWLLLALDYQFPSKALHWLSDVYKSKLVGLYLGEFAVVVAHGADAVKELLVRREFDGRMDVIVGRLRADGKRLGIFFTDGMYWHEQRRFTLRYMRDWGFGRRCPRLEQLIADEITAFIDFLRKGPHEDQDVVKRDLVFLPDALYPPLINSLLGVFRGQSLGPETWSRQRDVGRAALLFQRNGDDLGGALSMTPWIRHIIPQGSGYQQLCAGNQIMKDFIRDIVDECKRNFSEEYDDNFFDKYLRIMRKENETKEDSTFSEEQLILIGIDFLFPSSSANAVTLTLLIRELLRSPDVQDKIHAEIDSVVGQGRLPNLDDRNKMPYTEASLREVMRIVPLVPLGLPHRAQVDTNFNGYFIPKDTMMVANIWSYHMDPEIWDDPNSFRPERFLDENGRLDLKKDKSLIFGAGKRLCAGETFARQTMFLLAAGLFQNFHVSAAEGVPFPELIPGLITTPENFWVKFTPRH